MIDLIQKGLIEKIGWSSTGELFWLVLLCGLGATVIPYLLGSINTAVLVSKFIYRDDIRNHGSGNAGLTNTLRTFGKSAAVIVLLGDILKTVLAVYVGGLFFGMHYLRGYAIGYGGYVAAVFCILGHVYPVFHKFKGGKGVLCSAISGAVLCPFVFLVVIITFIIVVAFTKYVSLGSVVGGLMYPLYQSLMYRIYGATPPAWATLFALFVAVFLTWRHKENLKRLRDGTESKLSFKKKEPADTNHDHE